MAQQVKSACQKSPAIWVLPQSSQRRERTNSQKFPSDLCMRAMTCVLLIFMHTIVIRVCLIIKSKNTVTLLGNSVSSFNPWLWRFLCLFLPPVALTCLQSCLSLASKSPWCNPKWQPAPAHSWWPMPSTSCLHLWGSASPCSLCPSLLDTSAEWDSLSLQPPSHEEAGFSWTTGFGLVSGWGFWGVMGQRLMTVPCELILLLPAIIWCINLLFLKWYSSRSHVCDLKCHQGFQMSWQPRMVAQASKASYWGGWGRRISNSKPAWATAIRVNSEGRGWGHWQ